MANELTYDNGLAVTLQYTITNVGAGTTPVDGTLASGNGMTGYTVPTGYEFHALHLNVEYNDARTAGDSTVKVTSGGTELTGGPEAVIDASNTTNANGSERPGADPIAAGNEVAVSATGDGSFAPTTADADVILIGVLLPA